MNTAQLLKDRTDTVVHYQSSLLIFFFESLYLYPFCSSLMLRSQETYTLQGQQRKGPSSPCIPGSLPLSKITTGSNLSTVTFTSDSTAVLMHGPDEYERKAYYNGITGDRDHPHLVYRSDFLATPFPRPVGRYGQIPVKSLRGVFDTPLNGVWDTVGPQIRDIIKAKNIHWSSIDPARFFTHAPLGGDVKGSLGPVVIWIGVTPGSTSIDIAHEVSQEILTLLQKNGVNGVVVEWREAVLHRLTGPPLMRHVDSSNATHHVRRFLTALLGVPLATGDDSQGTLTLWFHENKDKDGNPSNKVYGVSNCHVLRNNTTVDYEHRGGAPVERVRVCGERRFQRGLDEIEEAIHNRDFLAKIWAQDIASLQGKERQDAENARAIKAKQRQLDDETEAIADLKALRDEVKNHWPDIKLHRNIGHVQHAAAISVDVEGGTHYTSDWAAFLVVEAKVKDEFEGNVVDLGVFRLVLFTSSNKNDFIQDPSTILKSLQTCSMLVVVAPPHLSFPTRGSCGSRAVPQRRTSNTPQSSTVTAGPALWLERTAALLASLLDSMPA